MNIRKKQIHYSTCIPSYHAFNMLITICNYSCLKITLVNFLMNEHESCFIMCFIVNGAIYTLYLHFEYHYLVTAHSLTA